MTNQSSEFPNRCPTSANDTNINEARLCVSANSYNKRINFVEGAEWLQNACQLVPALSFLENLNLQFLESCSWAMLESCETHPISKDGNCLFSTMSVLLTGNDKYSSAIRKFICDNLYRVPLTSIHFVAQQGNNCTNSSEYLRQSKMRENGIYGGDIEISVFCTVFGVDLVVYVDSFSSWVVYSGFHGNNEPLHMFIRHFNNHWEPIICVKRRQLRCRKEHGVFSDSFCVEGIGGEEYTNEEMEGISIQRDIIGEDTVLKQSANFSIDFCLFDNNQITIESHDLVSTEKCQKCCRRSTVWYPLEYKVLKSQSIMKRKFGLKVVGNARLCQECFQYVSVCGDIWKNAWPSVLFDLVFVKANHKMVELFFKLPRQIQFSWLFDRLKYKGRKIEQPLFLDITRDIFEFNRLIGSYLIKDYREALTRYPFPSVRCICGASEFIERAGDIELKHLLNYIESGFSDFHANWKNNLRCIRSDFLELCDNQLVFQLRPTVKVTSDGLVLCLCSYHSKGSSRAMIHVPRHPVVGNIMHESADRFSPLVCSLRNATPAKVGEFSNTFTMSQSVGGSNGVGSLTLHSFRNLNIRSDFLLHALESTFLNNRIDMRGFFEELADENKFTEEDTKGFIGKPFYHKRDFEKCVGSATYVPMTHMTNLKEDERSHILTNRKNYVIVENNCSNSGSKAVFPTKTCFNLNYNISLFLTILFCLPRFSEFFTVLDNTFWDPVSKIRRKIHLRKAGFKELYEKIHSFLGTNENDTFIEFWQKLSLKMGSISILKENLGPHSGLNKIKQPIILKLFKRGIKKNIEDLIFSGQYQIVARECSPLRNKYNLSLHRYIPRNSTIQIKTKDGTCKAFPGIVSESCNYRLLVYVLKPFISWDPMNIVSGQSKVSCVFHKQLLCCDQPKSNFICSENTCKLVSRWRCPKTSCAFCLCSKHFALVSHGNQLVLKKDVDKFVIAPFENEEETTSECPIQDDFLFHGLDEAVDVHNLLCNANTSEELFCGPSSSTNQLSESFDTDAGADFFPVVKQEKEGEDCKFLPIQVLFSVR